MTSSPREKPNRSGAERSRLASFEAVARPADPLCNQRLARRLFAGRFRAVDRARGASLALPERRLDLPPIGLGGSDWVYPIERAN